METVSEKERKVKELIEKIHDNIRHYDFVTSQGYSSYQGAMVFISMNNSLCEELYLIME